MSKETISRPISDEEAAYMIYPILTELEAYKAMLEEQLKSVEAGTPLRFTISPD